MKRILFATILLVATFHPAFAQFSQGPYDNALTGLSPSSMAAWATSATIQLGTFGGTGVRNEPGVDPLFNVLGPADAATNSDQTKVVISLGNSGSITLAFDSMIRDGAGADFAVFENAFDFFGNPQTVDNRPKSAPTDPGLTTAGLSGTFNATFAELGFVAVSSDGVNFVTFPSIALTDTSGRYFNEFGNDFLGIDSTDISGLAGKNVNHPFASTLDIIGTPFDLSVLGNEALVLNGTVNLNAIRYVRVTDVVGDGSTFDSMGRPIFDPFGETTGTVVGFDLDAIGVRNAVVPEPSVVLLFASAASVLCLRRGRMRRA